VEAQQVHLGDFLRRAEPVVTDHHEQGLLEPGLVTHLVEELPQRPVRITHRRQMLVQRAIPLDSSDRQLLG